MIEKLNIYQKLIEVRKAVIYLKKESKGYQYNYNSSSQVLSSIRGKLDELGLLLVPRILEHNVLAETVEGKDKYGNQKKTTTYFTELTIEFTWINAEKPEETIVCSWYGQGVDIAGEKGVGKALTYAEKYFILKTFNIPTDHDDPDSFQQKIRENGNKENGLKSNKQKVKTNTEFQANPGGNSENNLGPHINGVTYKQDGNFVVAEGNTFQSKGLLKSAGFVWNKLKEKAWAMPVQ